MKLNVTIIEGEAFRVKVDCEDLGIIDEWVSVYDIPSLVRKLSDKSHSWGIRSADPTVGMTTQPFEN